MNGRLALLFFLCSMWGYGFAQRKAATMPREHLLLDFGWRFAFGHPYDTRKDFNTGTGYFSYLTKAGYGDGAAATNFDDRTWRLLQLPHDWAVEQPFDSKGSFSHGFKAIGRNFPDRSVGWYRKTFTVPTTDSGRRISILFDGVFRNSMVWINGHYLGTESSGYLGFEYDLTDYLNYGGENVIAVRADVTLEEGWFYEGAGIYRHVWLNKTAPLHVATNGSYVTTKVNSSGAAIMVAITLKNDNRTMMNGRLQQTVIDAEGKVITRSEQAGFTLNALEENTFTNKLQVPDARLWDIENPYLYKLVTTVVQDGKTVDTYITSFGIRTIRFDANEGFFLNGKHLKIKGTNNHQDHAGVGTAMPDGLIDFRIRLLKEMGSNAYRCSHHPPTPELLDACDRLGMLVIDENRLLGTTAHHLNEVKRMIDRDRNHPCIISWSIGNEEWAVENNSTGARIATTMQAYVKTLDTTRPVTYAFSGGITQGIAGAIDLMGYNYVMNKNTDVQHRQFPKQLSWGTEEGSTVATRGEYANDAQQHYRAAYDEPQNSTSLSIEQGWKWYAERPYLAGMYIWTGFDYRGEPTPYGWPSTTSLFGMMDLCGFPKDNVYYLKSWWLDKPVIHLLPHWNWPGKEGKPVAVWVHSNCDEVELFLNKKSLGKKKMLPNSHLEWQVTYQPGTVEAVGYKKGIRTIADTVQTAGTSAGIAMHANVPQLKADKEAIAVITVAATDAAGLPVPTAGDEITFTVDGPARIIGVGNGKPTSQEPDTYLPTLQVVTIDSLREKIVADVAARSETAATYNDAAWNVAFKDDRMPAFGDTVKALVYRGSFAMPELKAVDKVTFFYNSLGREQSLFVNGKMIATNLPQSPKGNVFELTASQLQAGRNTIAIAATPLLKKQPWDVINMNPGLVQITTPAAAWKRQLFNGLAQVIVQSNGGEGPIIITATAKGLQTGKLKLEAVKAVGRPAVADN